MNRFKGQKARRAYENRFAHGVPEHISSDAHKKIRILMAARSLQDVGILGRIVRWQKSPEWYGIELQGSKWHVLFRWSNEFGAFEISLERR